MSTQSKQKKGNYKDNGKNKVENKQKISKKKIHETKSNLF